MRFQFLHIPSNTSYCLSWYYSCPSGCWAASHCGFDLYSPNDWWYWACFHRVIANLYVFSREMSIQTLCPFKNWVVAQWLRIHLPRQGTRVRALVQEDPTCRGATKPVHHNYWACALEPASHSYWAHVPQLLKPAHLEPLLQHKRSHRNEKPMRRNEE